MIFLYQIEIIKKLNSLLFSKVKVDVTRYARYIVHPPGNYIKMNLWMMSGECFSTSSETLFYYPRSTQNHNKNPKTSRNIQLIRILITEVIV